MKLNSMTWIEKAFILIIGIVVSVILISSFTLRFKSAVIPIATSIIIIVLLGIEMLNTFIRKREKKENQLKPTKNSEFKQKRVIGVFLWVVVTGLLIYFIGFLIATFLSSVIYFRLYGQKTLIRSIVIAVLFSSFIYIIFVVLAKFGLYKGLFFT